MRSKQWKQLGKDLLLGLAVGVIILGGLSYAASSEPGGEDGSVAAGG